MADRIAPILGKLISFPSVSSASNLDQLDYIEALVAPLGATTRRFPNPAGDKASLLVSLGPDRPGGLVFSGHTDIVPTTGQAWLADPFTMRESNGRLIGRGATDMKGFLACALASLGETATAPLARPLHLAFSYDEEVGCTGVGEMAEWIGRSGLAPRLAVIGEATMMDLVSAHKGGMIGWAIVTGRPGHSSQPDRYVNAVMTGAELIAFINQIRADLRAGPRFEALDPPYSTIQVNQITGGTHGNIVAEQCRFFWEMRLIPGESTEAVLARMRRFAEEVLEPPMKAIAPEASIRFEVQASIPGLEPNGDDALEARLLGLLGRKTARAVPYGTEAGIFQRAGVPAVVIGPGDIADAHQPEESIAIDQLAQCGDFLRRLVVSELLDHGASA